MSVPRCRQAMRAPSCARTATAAHSAIRDQAKGRRPGRVLARRAGVLGSVAALSRQGAWSTSVRDFESALAQTLRRTSDEFRSLAFLPAAPIAFRRWRHAGGNDIASLGLIVEVAAVGLGSFAFHASLVPLPCLFCSYLFVVRHRLPRLPAHSADILNGPIGYVPALGIVRLRCAPDTPAPAGVGPQRGAGTCAENWPVATRDIRGVHDVARVTIE